jgi:hypothetical protein
MRIPSSSAPKDWCTAAREGTAEIGHLDRQRVIYAGGEHRLTPEVAPRIESRGSVTMSTIEALKVFPVVVSESLRWGDIAPHRIPNLRAHRPIDYRSVYHAAVLLPKILSAL